MRIFIIFNKLINKSLQKLYWPICRLYARWLGDRPADYIYKFLCSVAFFQIHHYWPNLNKPSSFSEKIFFRMLYDRRPLLTLISDKLLVRDFVADRIGHQYLVPLLWSGADPKDIPCDQLPSKFVIKTNHGCGFNIFIDNKNFFNLDELIPIIKGWLKTNFALKTYLGNAWAYKNISPKIIIEEYIEEEGKPPKDFKFFCFSGRVEYIQVSFDRFENPSERMLDRDFNILDIYNGVKLYDGKIEPPIGFSKMIEIAETLSSNFDFIRVDLYTIKGKIYFGELTCYPAGGLAPFVPREWDFIFGEKWHIEKT